MKLDLNNDYAVAQTRVKRMLSAEKKMSGENIRKDYFQIIVIRFYSSQMIVSE